MITWSHLDDASVPAWAALTNLLATADDTGEFYEADDLAEELTEAGFDRARDSWAAWDGDDMVAFGQLRVGTGGQEDGSARCQLDGGVHPRWRGRGIGTELIRRMEERAAELTAERNPGLPFHFRASGGKQGSTAAQLLEGSGYRIVRWFTYMERQLPGAPAGEVAVEVVIPTDDDEEAVRLAHNAAFLDHYGFAPLTVERWRDLWHGRVSRPQFSSIVKDANGAVLAYALAQQYVAGELYVALVGTVREARGRGLARACLSRTIDLARRDGGFNVVELDVDSESPTGADRLYTSLGFEVTRSLSVFRRDG